MIVLAPMNDDCFVKGIMVNLTVEAPAVEFLNKNLLGRFEWKFSKTFHSLLSIDSTSRGTKLIQYDRKLTYVGLDSILSHNGLLGLLFFPRGCFWNLLFFCKICLSVKGVNTGCLSVVHPHWDMKSTK